MQAPLGSLALERLLQRLADGGRIILTHVAKWTTTMRITIFIYNYKKVRPIKVNGWNILPVASIVVVDLADLLGIRFGA